MDKMLPTYIVDSLRTYKKDTAAFLTWLATAGQSSGYDVNSSTTGGYSAAAPKPRRNPSLLRQMPAQQELQMVLFDTSHILPLAQTVAAGPKKLSKVPIHVKEALQRAIKDRERCNAWYQNQHVGAAEPSDDDKGHAYFVILLKQAFETLENHFEKKQPIKSVVKKIEEKQALPDLINPFEWLTVEDILDKEASDSRHNTHNVFGMVGAPASGCTSKSEPQERVYTVKEAEEDPTMAIFCLLEDLASLQAFIRELWEQRKRKEITSLTAGVCTHAALDFAKALEMNAFGAHREGSGWEEAVLKGNVSAQNEGELKSKPTIFPFIDLTKALVAFRDLEYEELKTYCAEIAKSLCYSMFGASFTLEQLERFSILRHVPTWKLILASGKPVSRDPLTDGLDEALRTKRIALATVFALQIYQDIFNIMDGDAGYGFEDVESTAKRVHESVDSFFSYQKRMLPSPDQRFTDSLQYSQEASLFLADRHTKNADKILFVRHNHPLALGILETRLALGLYEDGRELAEHLSLVRASIHLYNALLQSTELKEPWPAMERTIEYFTPEKIFVGPRPNGLAECLRRCELSEGASLTKYAKGTRDTTFKRATQPRRSMFETIPVLQMLSQRYLGDGDGSNSVSVDQDLIEEIVSTLPAGKHNKSQKGRLRKQWDASQKMGPVQVLTLLRDAVSEAEPRLTFDFFGAHRKAWQILRTLWLHHGELITQWFPALAQTNKDSVDKVLHAIPLMVLTLCNSKAVPSQEAGKKIMERASYLMSMYRSGKSLPIRRFEKDVLTLTFTQRTTLPYSPSTPINSLHLQKCLQKKWKRLHKES